MYSIDGIQYFTVDDVAKTFEVEPNTVNVWVKRNHLVPFTKVKIGRYHHNLFTRQSVSDFAQRKYGN